MMLAVVLLVAVYLALGESSKDAPWNTELDFHWEAFKTNHGKRYEDFHEELKRRLIFEQNYFFIETYNARPDKDFYLAMNQFGDLTNKEYRDTYLGFKRPSEPSRLRAKSTVEASNAALPDEIDWRTKGWVTPVKNQGQCGSCWAFSAVGALEGLHAKTTGTLVSLSEQNLVDCSSSEGNSGCDGGWMDQAFEYIMHNNGIDTERSYPYVGHQMPCHFKANSTGATLSGYMDVKSGDEEALRHAVANHGPVSVAIDAGSMFFQFYRGGVYNLPECSSTKLNHGVLVVGYGTQFQGKDYWLVKNSWGKGWGIYGFIEMSRNKRNQCGIATNASLPFA